MIDVYGMLSHALNKQKNLMNKITEITVLGTSAISAIIGWALGISSNVDYAYIAGKESTNNLTLAEAQEIIEDDMRRHCNCWFTDSRCRNTPKLIIACTAPEWILKR